MQWYTELLKYALLSIDPKVEAWMSLSHTMQPKIEDKKKKKTI